MLTFDQLKTKHGMFQILDEKMNDKRHKQMDCVLSKAEMLALILYCNGKVDGDLSICQRDGTYVKKWSIFDMLLKIFIQV